MIKPAERETTTFTFRFEKASVQNRLPERRSEDSTIDETPPAPSVTKIALLLALAHHMERQLATGAIKSQNELAERMGITRARVTQIMNLTLLAPEIQEHVLLKHDARITERHVRRLVSTPAFPCQRRHWSALLAETSPAD